VRFTVVEQPSPSETDNDQIDDDHQASGLSHRKKLALRFADAFLSAAPVVPSDVEQLRDEFDDDALAEMGIGLALFHGFSKFLIVTGCEPENMPTTVLAAPVMAP
jgi:alkylhydroperoxidase family enzyme